MDTAKSLDGTTEIKYSSPDPQLSADIANAVATSFNEQNTRAKFLDEVRKARREP